MSVLQKHYQWAAVCAIYETLRAHGHTALLTGGCVRDALLKRIPKDLDMATDASPELIEALFPRTVGVGKSFGVMRVLVEGADIEVATFREDGDYLDGRRPEAVVFSTPERDAERRDFTINALFLDPGVEAVLDFVGGQADLQARVLRAVGDPEKRFREDHLRILRAVRFSGQLGFEIEAQTFAAIQKMASLVTGVSAERLYEEMSKLLATDFRGLALQQMEKAGLLKVLFPFRGADSSFLGIPTRENWQRWSLFFLSATNQASSGLLLKGFLDKLKFPLRDKKFILEALAVVANPGSVLTLPFAERLVRYANESVRWGLQILSYQGGSAWQGSIEDVHQNWLHLGGALPSAFLTGHDVPAHIQGKTVGDLLKKVYLLQIEGKITSRAEALDFLVSADAK